MPVTMFQRLLAIMNMFRYLKQYWTGAQPLWRAFLVNLIVLGAVILWLMGRGLPWLHMRSALPVHILVISGLILLLPVVTWQLVGLWRTLRLRLGAFGGVHDSWVIYAGMLGYVWLLLLTVLDLSRFVTVLPPPAQVRPATEIVLVQPQADTAASVILLKGALEFGLTRNLESLLQSQPDIRTLLLNSPGGYIGEARGVMRLIREYTLSTHVDHECFSACTLLFVSSAKRTIGPQAQLGFHQYSMLPGYNTPWVDLDRELMQAQGVAPWFIDRAYAEPHTGLWRPEVEELLSSGMVTRITQDHASGGGDAAQTLTTPAQ